jgi:hypothetical protein
MLPKMYVLFCIYIQLQYIASLQAVSSFAQILALLYFSNGCTTWNLEGAVTAAMAVTALS